MSAVIVVVGAGAIGQAIAQAIARRFIKDAAPA